MIKHSTHSDLLHNLFELLEQHRRAFRQERSYWRLARDYERLPETLTGLHFLAFTILMLRHVAELLTQSS